MDPGEGAFAVKAAVNSQTCDHTCGSGEKLELINLLIEALPPESQLSLRVDLLASLATDQMRELVRVGRVVCGRACAAHMDVHVHVRVHVHVVVHLGVYVCG